MSNATPSILQAMLRGTLGHCPHCANGALFRAYLKPVDACSACGESFRNIRADDGPAWLTVLISGHIVLATALLADATMHLSETASILILCALTLVLCFSILPRAKGFFIAAIWAQKADGVDHCLIGGGAL